MNNINYYNLLTGITEIIENINSIDLILDEILSELNSITGVKKCIITIFNTEKNEISIEKATGITKEQMQKGRYKIGEGIIGKVVEEKKPVIIPDITKEPNFLNKTMSIKSNEKVSFYCVPIKNKNEVLGTISVHKEIEDSNIDTDFLKLLTLIAFMISEEVRILKLEKEKDHENVLRLIEENSKLREEIERAKFHPEFIVGNSKEIKEVFSLIEKVSKTDANVLILGESGVGKELVANAIHLNSNRKNGPFIKINCAAIPDNLIESELFGYEKGAFTGALSFRKGKFELANNGSIFLDEISEIPLNTQVKLLRVLQELEIEILGGGIKKVDVRIMAATNKNLEEAIKEKKFRDDLYYRLNVFPIYIPPLRSRKSDIPLLIDYFIKKYSKKNSKNIKRISTPAIDMLVSYHWPGNVRELENVIERAVILTEDEVIHSYHLPPTLQTADYTNTAYNLSLQKKLEEVEYEMIIEALKITRGNATEASKILGVTERMMGIRLKKYNVDYRIFRSSKFIKH